MSWFGWKKEEENDEEPKEGEEGQQQQQEGGGGMFSGAMSYMKGLLGMESLKIEETGEEGKNDDTAEKRKGLFKTLSSMIGKDVTSLVSLPVWIFEPMSFLQVMAEPLEYEEFLRKAAKEQDPYLRMAYVAAFQCGLYSTAVRTKKPFNPLLGETFEIVSSKRDFKFIAEQVSHHPPIGVSQTTGPGYTLQLETELHTKFFGNSSEVYIHGTNHLELKDDHYSWGHLNTVCHNIIIGSIWLDHYGDLTIVSHKSGMKCTMKFAKAGWLGVGRYGVNAEITDADGNLKMRLFGKWNEDLKAVRVGDDGKDGEEVIVWEAHKDILEPGDKFGFSKFIHEEIINLTPELEALLPVAPYPMGPTDSRLREDRRALELNDLEVAGKAKHQMEEVQRSHRRDREGKAEDWTTKYFTKHDDETTGYRWKFNGKYWTEREERANRLASQK